MCCSRSSISPISATVTACAFRTWQANRDRQARWPYALSPLSTLRTAAFTAIPPDGVYAGQVWRLDGDGRTVGTEPLGTSAISVGSNPTFDVTKRRVEAHLLDFDDDLYGHSLGVEFSHRLRGMVKFDGVDALVAQMHEDVAQIRTLI